MQKAISISPSPSSSSSSSRHDRHRVWEAVHNLVGSSVVALLVTGFWEPLPPSSMLGFCFDQPGKMLHNLVLVYASLIAAVSLTQVLPDEVSLQKRDHRCFLWIFFNVTGAVLAMFMQLGYYLTPADTPQIWSCARNCIVTFVCFFILYASDVLDLLLNKDQTWEKEQWESLNQLADHARNGTEPSKEVLSREGKNTSDDSGENTLLARNSKVDETSMIDLMFTWSDKGIFNFIYLLPAPQLNLRGLETFDIERFEKDAKTGDLLLFKSDRPSSWMVRVFLNSPFCHVGMVIRGALPFETDAELRACGLMDSENCIRILEADTSCYNEKTAYRGYCDACVMLHDYTETFREFSDYSGGDKCLWRSLRCSDNRRLDDIQNTIKDCAYMYVGTPYNTNNLFWHSFLGVRKKLETKTFFCSSIIATIFALSGVFHEKVLSTSYFRLDWSRLKTEDCKDQGDIPDSLLKDNREVDFGPMMLLKAKKKNL